MAGVVIENISKSFSGTRGEKICAVDKLNLSVRNGEFLVLVGPSGCGKTTALRCIAGLEVPDSGTISLDGVSFDGVPAKDRNVAMVFQTPALFPHLTVFENLGFGLMLRKFSKSEIQRRVTAAAETLGLTALLQRKPQSLSGGECQRVALGRALVRQPKVFLLDEPLSNLDAPSRAQLRSEIAKLQKHLGVPMIYVTHDQTEAIKLGHRIAVMNRGQLQQIGTSQEIRERPANNFVVEFFKADS